MPKHAKPETGWEKFDRLIADLRGPERVNTLTPVRIGRDAERREAVYAVDLGSRPAHRNPTVAA